jgi:glycosyltransferase involved in cell wall biosynthesis
MTISVVIPAYNAEKYIARTISSVLAQTTKPDEIIIVDDGSTDNTASEIKKFADSVTYIHQQNAGASVARNTGIEHAKSDWIAFLDADDQWLPTHLQCQHQILERNPQLAWSTANFEICFCNDNKSQIKLDPDISKNLLAGKDYFENYFEAFIAGSTGWTGTMLIKKNALKECGMFTPGQPVANDLDMWWRIAYRHRQIGYNPDSSAIYHFHVANSITKTHKDPTLMGDLLEKHLAIAKQMNKEELFVPCASHMLHYLIHQYILDDRIYSVSHLIKRFKHILEFRYYATLRILMLWPTATKKALPLLQKINKTLKLRI